MGYKSTIRSISAASKRYAREKEREQKQHLRMMEKLQKKADSYNEKLEKIYLELENAYASGKIDKDQYNKLSERKIDITIDLIAVGKTPYVSLAKRFITGKIDHNEYETILTDILPSDYITERDQIVSDYVEFVERIEVFRKKSKKANDGFCQYCGKKKTFFNSIKLYENIELCSKCMNQLKSLQQYTGYDGYYLFTDSKIMSFSKVDSEEPFDIQLNLGNL